MYNISKFWVGNALHDVNRKFHWSLFSIELYQKLHIMEGKYSEYSCVTFCNFCGVREITLKNYLPLPLNVLHVLYLVLQ